MVGTPMLLAIYVVQCLCFQVDVADALKREIRHGYRRESYRCEYNTTRDEKVHRCCPGFYYNGSQCTECPKANHEKVCKKTCKCESYEQCHHGKVCRCPVGKLGDRCQHNCQCYTRATCDRDSGKCKCETGWIGDTCTDCDENHTDSNGTYFCDDKCLHCFNGPSCDITQPGDCHCTPGWTGNRCNVSAPITCDSSITNDMCRNHSDCDDFHICNLKTCKCDRCIQGYRRKHCTLPCKQGKYGFGCKNQCNDTCGSEQCHHVSGNCRPCSVGYHGRDCNEECPANHYGYNCQERCQCPDNMTCNHKVGCVNGSEDGTTPSSDITLKLEESEVATEGRPSSHNPATKGYEGTTQPHYNEVIETQGQEDNTISERPTDPVTNDYNLFTMTQGRKVNTITTERTYPVTNDRTDTTKPQIKLTLTKEQGTILITEERTEPANIDKKSTRKPHNNQGTKTQGEVGNIITAGHIEPTINDQKDTKTKPNHNQVTLTHRQEETFIKQESTDPATQNRKGTIKVHNNKVITTNGQQYNTINKGRTDLVTNDKQSTMKQSQDNRISGGFDYIENNLPLVIGVCVFLVFLTIVNAVICLVCHRRRTRTANKRSGHYDNLDMGTERTNNLAMFLSPDDYEMVDVRTQVTTFLANGGDESTRDEGHRNKSIPENTQVDKTRKKKTKEVTNQEYSQITANYDTVNDNSHNAPRGDVHYYTVGEADDKQTTFTGNGSLSGQMYSVEGYSGSAGGAGEQADYNVVDRTGKSFKTATDNNELNNYEEIDIINENVSTNEDTIYNKLNFGAKRLRSIRKTDYS